MKPDLTVHIGKVRLKNPIMTASGTFGYGEEFNENFYPISRLGAVITKGISLEPRQGNKMPRLAETPSGLINAIGLENVGVEKFVREKLPYLKKNGATVIVNIFGSTIDEYARVASILDEAGGIDGIELNISCPNVGGGGIQFGTDPKLAAWVTRAVRKKTSLSLIVKLSPNVTDIVEIGAAAELEGADAVSAINTITAMAVDIKKKRPVLANTVGGLSGPAIKPIALRMVWQLAQRLKIPVIGVGGIMSVTDVIEFLLVGASAVQVGTANFVEPMVGERLIGELEKYFKENKIEKTGDIIGRLERAV